MIVRLGDLRRFLYESIDCWGGSRPEEMYSELLVDDPTYNHSSVMVPDDIKFQINKWMKLMCLSSTEQQRQR